VQQHYEIAKSTDRLADLFRRRLELAKIDR